MAALLLTAGLSQAAFAAGLPAKIEVKGATMVLIPEGDFIMGSDKVDTEGRQSEFGSIKPWYLDEHPQHKVHLPAYYIDQHEVTNAQYREFVKQTHHELPVSWIDSGYVITFKMEKLKQLPVEKLRNVVANKLLIDVDTRQLNKEQLLEVVEKHFAKMDKLPVQYVNWFDAYDYCKWAGGQLPTEAQWERAARGDAGNEFPWGNDFEPGLSNTGNEEWEFGVAPTGSYDSDKSPFNVYDMAGNVSEWVTDWYDAYPNSDYKSEQYGNKFKVIRGAGWGGSGHYALKMYQRGAYRLYLTPDSEHEDLGFRCAVEASKGVALAAKSKH